MDDNIVVNLDVLCEIYEAYSNQRAKFAEDIGMLNGIIKMLEQGMITTGGEEAIKAAQAICNQANDQLQQMDVAIAYVRTKYEAYLAEISGTIA